MKNKIFAILASTVLTDPETRYTLTEKEAMGYIWEAYPLLDNFEKLKKFEEWRNEKAKKFLE